MHKYFCANCKQPIPQQTVVGPDGAWCNHCCNQVRLSLFETQGWVLGVLVLLIARLQFGLLA